MHLRNLETGHTRQQSSGRVSRTSSDDDFKFVPKKFSNGWSDFDGVTAHATWSLLVFFLTSFTALPIRCCPRCKAAIISTDNGQLEENKTR